MRTSALRPVWLALGFCALAGLLYAEETTKEGEGPKEKAPKPAAKAAKEGKSAEAKPPQAPREDAVAKVDDLIITRADLNGMRRLITVINPQATLNNKQLLDQLISRIVWSRYFDKNGLRPTPQDLQQAVGQMDAELRKRGSDYRSYLASQRLRPEEHLALLSHDLAMQVLIRDIQAKLDPAEVKAEFNDHPDWYDGSRIRLSQILIDTTNIAHDPKELDKAKQRIDQLYAKVAAGADFDGLAKDYSDGGAGGDRGWFLRKGANVDETLIKAVWDLKVGEYTKPMLGPTGWHILKVTDREPAAFTFHGCKQRIIDELARRRLEALLNDLKAAAKIETYL